ncbi:efflux RND transporter periplasmic adaptor subunit [Heliophilum fasciatum]|uniref:RND family efflux transporter MFP subunit n=1 Tax=Heliophilum fasciatum TaxID=35700 RepID=A0A4R2RYK2_9FIRM|nr:efflux RND transporter periplasmic adaptor subunit [Heliophilum fasciatum]MCW2276856.1 multidrug efflux pump subunit AcrA (membrane-fusion protein) [Heliophilum fasciatum]TCP68683.1 RND family efflux transporter MFP subunit [Heliophilum fasciatum]
MRKKALILLLAATMIVTTTACGKKATTPTEAGAVTPVVTTAKAEKTKLSTLLSVSGKIAPVEEVSVVPKTSGKVARVYSDVGQSVGPGTVLLELENNDLQAKLDGARASLASAQANLDRAKSQVAKTQVQLDDARRNLERQKELFNGGIVTQAALDTAQTNYDSIKQDYDMNVASVAAAQASVEQSRATIAQTQVDLDNTRITSPIAGTVTSKNADVGEVVSSSTAPFVVMNLSRVEVMVNISEDDINQVRTGMPAEVTVTAAAPEPFQGQVSRMSPAADSKTKMYPVWVTIDNPQGLLKPGMFAEVHLLTQVRENAVMVPSEAIAERAGKKVIYVLDGDKAAERNVTTGQVGEKQTEITAGVQAGETIITSRLMAIRNGTVVRVEEPTAGQGGQGNGGAGVTQGERSGQGNAAGAQGERGGQGSASSAPGERGAGGQRPAGAPAGN